MSTEQERIDMLYPNASPPVDDAAPPATPDSRLHYEAEEQPVGNPYALDPGSVQDRLYGGAQRTELSSETDLSIISGGDPEAEANLHTNLGYIASTVGASQSDIEGLVSLANKYLMTGGTGQSPQEVMRGLYDDYGSDLNRLLNQAETLVRSFPEVREWLDNTGAGNDPQIIRNIIRIAQSPRAQARLETLMKGAGK